MFLFLLFLFSSIQAVELCESDSNIQLVEIDVSPIFHLQSFGELNTLSNPMIESFSKDLTFYYENNVEGSKRTIKHRHHGNLMLQPYENTSRMRAYDANNFYWVQGNNELMSCDFKTKTNHQLMKLSYKILAIKLSKIMKNHIYLIARSSGHLEGALQNHWLFLFDTQTKKKIKEIPFRLIPTGYNGKNFKIVELDNYNCILYCRYAGKNNACLLDSQSFDAIKLPFHHVHTCKTNEQRNLIAIDHNNHTICVCSSSKPEKALYSFAIDKLTPQSMRFISDDYLIVTARDNFTIPPLKAALHSKPFDASSNNDFRKTFESLKAHASITKESHDDKPENAGVYVFDLAQKKEIFKKNLCLKYGFRLIKPWFDEDGSLKTNQFALRDYGCFDGEWYMLSITGLEDNQ